MEPLDTAKNDENSGSSKRRISSILKAPRTSIRFSDPEQLVIPVEVAKPVEKRNSKRVSFAPANDVLLFSKDVENVSSAQSPLQDLTTTVANVDQRVQMGVTEGGIQPITGMETLLNAPLHACQQRHEEIFMVNPDTEDDCTEKTMMFAADDASMDVTRSHTIIIANDSESNAVLPEQNCDPLPTCRNMDFSFSMERKKGETCGPPRNIPSSVHGLDPEFENFLASLSKLSGPRGGTPVMTKVVPAAAPSPQETVYTNVFLAQLEAQRAAVDKENEAPAFMSTMMEKPLNKTRKKRESSNRSVVYPEDDVSMDMTEAHTGNIVGNISMNEPLKCLFPTQQLYPHSGHLKTTEMTLRQQNSEALGSSSNPNGMEIIKNPAAVIDSKICGRELPSLNVTRSKLDLNLCQGEDTRYKTSPSESDDMDITRSQTVAIEAESLHAVNTLQKKKQKSLSFMTASSKTSNAFEADSDDMEFTRCQTRVIEAKNLDTIKPLLSFGTGRPVSILDSNKKEGKEVTKYHNCESDDMEITRSQTVAIDAKSIHAVKPTQNNKRKSLAFMTASTKASNTSENECGMDMTKAFTVSIDHISQSDRSKISEKPLKSLFPKTDNELETWRAEVDFDDMEFTRCQTRVIEAKNLDLLKPLSSFGTGGPVGMLNSNKKRSEDDNGMDLTACQGKGLKYHDCESDDMEITRSQTVAIDAKSLHAVKPMQDKKRKSLAFVTVSPKASNTSEVECGMDMTKAFTVSTDHISKSDGSRMSDKDNLLPKIDREMVTSNIPEADGMEFTMCLSNGGSVVKLNSNSECLAEGNNSMEMTKAFTTAENLGNFPQSSAPFEDRSKALHNQENGTEAHIVDCMRSIPDGCTDLGDMEMTRDKAGPTNQGMVNVSLSTSVSSEDHEMRVKVKVNTVNIEQLNAPRNAVTSLPVPECQFNNQTNLPDYLDSKEIESGKDPELRHENSSLSHRFESSPDISPAIHQVDKLSSKNAQTRRRSWADLQSKLRRLSRRMNEATDNIAMDSRTAPLSQVENAADKNSIKTKSLPVVKCDLEMGLTDKEDNAQTENFTQGEQPSITAPLNLKTKRLTSRLSMGAFMPKLPQRSKPLEPNKVESSHMKTNTISVTQQFSNNILMDNIDDEVLPNISSDEDLSETLDTKTPQRISEKESSPQGLNIDEPLEEEVFEESFPNVVHDKKRPLPVDSQEDHVEDEKRRKPSTDNIVETRLPSHALECDSNITAAPSIITQTIDSSNSSNTANIRCEATFESTFKQSLFASQLEDCTNDIQKKLNDSITVLEFFKLFNVDFVIHNPRQSVLPGKLASDLDRRPKDLLKDIHINHPKQRLYEADLQNLTQKVEGLKVRKEDGNKPLKSVNRALWEEMRGLSEKELKCFGAKLKERCNFFRKRSKVQSHEMKEVLYSSLVQANLEEQLKLRGKIQEADETLKSLDDCIHELETEFAAVEGKGLEDSKPTLKSSQLGLEKVTRVLADNERQMSELEMQKKHKLDKLNRLRTETQDLESRITMLHLVNEWKLGEKRDNCTIYTFLYETLQLKVVFEKCDGNDTDDESQRKISDITFKFQLDDEMPRSHAHLVHKLLSQYIEGQTARVEKYPTSRFVPKLLHDVGLVVSRCRLLGEELRLLKMWGGMRLDILDMSYVDTQVRIVFSSLKAFSKFEFSVAFTSTYPYCVLQVQNFKNHIGSTTIHQIEEIVSSVTPAKNYLTKIVKRIHEALLC